MFTPIKLLFLMILTTLFFYLLIIYPPSFLIFFTTNINSFLDSKWFSNVGEPCYC